MLQPKSGERADTESKLWMVCEVALRVHTRGVRVGMTDFHKPVNFGNHFLAEYRDLLLQAAGYEDLLLQAAGYATRPHRLRIQTRIRPTDNLRNTLHDFG